jgi:hypothetical protein
MGTTHDLILDELRAKTEDDIDPFVLLDDQAKVFAIESDTEPSLIYYIISMPQTVICTCQGFRMSKVATDKDDTCKHLRRWRIEPKEEDDTT